MGNSIKNKLAVLVILFSCNLVNAQNLFIYGNKDVYVNSTHTYYFSLPAGIDLSSITPQWYVYGGTILSQSETTVYIRWTTSGNGSVKVSLPGYFSELAVRVTTFSDPAAPPNPIVHYNTCPYSVIVPVGSPPNGVTWYWQGQNPDGRTTDYGSSPYFFASTTGTYYLRAYKGSTGTWSEDLGSIYVTVGVHGGPLWYKDFDNDGFGDPLVSRASCTQPSGFVDNSLDCNDSDKLIHPNTKWYKDSDGDTYGSDLDVQVACIKPLGYVLRKGDCDDNNSMLNPNTLWYSDSDGDGFGDPNITKNQCSRPTGYVTNNYDLCPSEFGPHYGCTTPQTGTVSLNNDENYIYTVTYTKPYDLGQEGSASKQEKIEVVAYFDGLGRDKQIVTIRGGGLGEDIITPIAYDGLGRKVKDYLSYASIANSGAYRADALLATYTSVNGFYNTDRYEHTKNPYSETVFEPSPLNRPIAQYAPGEAWAKEGGNKPVTTKYLISSSDDEVLHFNLSPEGDAGATSYFGDGALEKLLITDENGHQSATFTDAFGKILLKRNYLSETEWADTYYLYDGWNNLRFVFPPESEGFLGTPPFTLGGSLYLDRYAFQYRYDDRNRMIWKKVPGADPVYMVYDSRDRLVLTQDGNQRNPKTGAKSWTFTKYDALNRPILTGTYEHGAADQDAMQTLVNNFYLNAPAIKYYEDRGSSVHGYTNRSYPLVSNESYCLTVTYYDNYAFRDELTDFGDNYEFKTSQLKHKIVNRVLYSFPPVENLRVKGQVTGSKIKILEGEEDQWIKTVNYYDEKYRPIQSITENHFGKKDIFSSLYDFPGKVLSTLFVHNSNTQTDLKTYNEFTYDHTGRLLETYHKINNGDPVLLSRNGYNELGELVKKDLHKEGSTYAQSVDYRYNIRGWLKRINNSDLSPDVGDDKGDLFGMELSYEDGFEVPQYNGNISGARWKNAVDNTERAYGYTYDPMNRLTGADYVAGGPGGWEQEEERFEVGNISYDHNGNILTLHRNGLFRYLPGEVPEYGITDQLTYYYKGNQLMAVNDAMDTPQETKNDFKDNGSKGDPDNPEYAYDANGNMVRDDNKGITVTYNHLNLPRKVDFGNNKYIEYTYDAAGTKLRQEVHDGQNPVKRTDYVGGMVYEDGQLQFIQHEEGRAVMVDNDGLSKFPEYQYHLKDHLGNVRLTFSASPEIESNTATLEPVHEEEENANFLRYAETTKINSALFDHTGSGDTHYAVRLNGSESERIGLAKSLAVMTGDTIRAEAYAKYLDPDPSNWTAALHDLMAAIAGGTAPTGTVIEAVPPVGGDGFPFAGLLEAAKAGDTGTRAYLNILLFDENLGFLDAAFVPVTTAAMENGTGVPHERLAEEIIVQQPGYAYIYFSNDNDQPLEVFFDDFTVEHSHSAIVQADDYYPFGLTFNSYSRENSVMNRYLYQGKELQPETGIYDFEWRGYDQALGRTWQQDPHAENYYSWSPYSWAFNNPLNIIDPDGRDGVATIDKENKTVQVSQTFHYSSSNAEVLKKALSNLGNGSMTIDEFMADFDSNWGGEASSMEIDGKEYSVGYSATFVAHDDDASRDEAVAADPTSNSLVFDRDLGPAGNWNGKSRTLSINPLKVRYDNTTFSHEAGHSMGLGHSDPTTSHDAQGNELSGGIMSYAWNRQVTPSERRATIYDAVNLSKTVKDTKVRVHIKGYWSKDHKNSPTIIK